MFYFDRKQDFCHDCTLFSYIFALRILEYGLIGLPVTRFIDYMSRLQTMEEGQTGSVEIIRNEEKLVLIVQL